MKRLLIRHKRRFDRGRNYYSYFQAIITAVLVRVFTVSKDWKMWIASALIMFTIIYIFGWIDDKTKLYNEEQEQIAKKNPITMKILEELKKLNDAKDNNSVQSGA